MKMNLSRFFIILAFAKAFTSCTPTHKVEEEIANIQVDVDLVTFHKEFANANAADLPRLKKNSLSFFRLEFQTACGF